MKIIIPPVLFLTFAGFLPKDCDAMHRFDIMGKPTVQPEESGRIVLTSQQDHKFEGDLMMDHEGNTEPYFLSGRLENNFFVYRACFITYPNLMHKSSDIFSNTAESQGYIEPTYVPKSVKVKALNVKYDAYERNWHVYDTHNRPPHPTSKEYARLFIAIPNTKQVLHKLFIERQAPAGVNNEAVRNEAVLEIHDKFRAQIRALQALPSSTWQ